MADAPYDGLAEWYDDYLKHPIYADLPRHVGRLVGSGSGLCVDAGCGTGAHLGLLASRGWRVAGIDLSTDQLRLARGRWCSLVQADAGSDSRLGLYSDSASRKAAFPVKACRHDGYLVHDGGRLHGDVSGLARIGSSRISVTRFSKSCGISIRAWVLLRSSHSL